MLREDSIQTDRESSKMREGGRERGGKLGNNFFSAVWASVWPRIIGRGLPTLDLTQFRNFFVSKVVQLNISVSITVNRFSCILADGWRLMDAGQDGCPSNRLRTQPNGRTSPQGKQLFM